MKFLIAQLFTLLASCSVLFCSGPVDSKEPSSREKLLFLVSGEWVAKGLYTAAELDIAGYLLDGPKNVCELAQLTQCNEEKLYRFLRMLASQGVFCEQENRLFSNTSTSELLAKDYPQSLRSLTLFFSKEMSQSWSGLSQSLKEEVPAFDRVFGKPIFAYFREHPESAVLFNAAMREKSKIAIASCLKSFDFGKFKSVYDIGGGTGHFLIALMKAYPTLNGVLYELPEVIAAAQNSPYEDRCPRLISGNFFDSIPSGGDAYLLKSVLHDWTDQDALKILACCRNAMKDDAKLIIVEPVMTSANQRDYAKLMDVHMMVVTGGRERTLQDFHNLLEKAGFSIESVTPTETEFSIIQAGSKPGSSSEQN